MSDSTRSTLLICVGATLPTGTARHIEFVSVGNEVCGCSGKSEMLWWVGRVYIHLHGVRAPDPSMVTHVNARVPWAQMCRWGADGPPPRTRGHNCIAHADPRGTPHHPQSLSAGRRVRNKRQSHEKEFKSDGVDRQTPVDREPDALADLWRRSAPALISSETAQPDTTCQTPYVSRVARQQCTPPPNSPTPGCTWLSSTCRWRPRCDPHVSKTSSQVSLHTGAIDPRISGPSPALCAPHGCSGARPSRLPVVRFPMRVEAPSRPGAPHVPSPQQPLTTWKSPGGCSDKAPLQPGTLDPHGGGIQGTYAGA